MADPSKYFSRVASSKKCTRIEELKLPTEQIQSGIRRLSNYQKERDHCRPYL